jgi:hypothetical protein
VDDGSQIQAPIVSLPFYDAEGARQQLESPS